MLRPVPALSVGLLFIVLALVRLAVSAGFDRGAFLELVSESAGAYGLPGFEVALMRASAAATEAGAQRMADPIRKQRLDLAGERELRAARLLLAQGDVAGAQALERKLKGMAPWREDVRFFAYEVQIAQKRDEEARKDLFEAVLDTDEAEASYLIGASFVAQGEEDEGAQYLAHAINRQADHYRANLALGLHYVRMGERRKAYERGTVALSAARTINERADAYELLGQAGADRVWLWERRAGDLARRYGETVIAVVLYLALMPLPWTIHKVRKLLHIRVGRFARRKLFRRREPVRG